MLLDKSPEVGSLYRKVAEFLMFLENSMFFVVTAPFYMHTKTQKFQSLQILIDTCYILLFSFFISLLCSLPPFLSLPSLPSFPPSFLLFFLSYFLYIFLSFFLSAILIIVQLLSQVQLYATPMTAAHQASLPFTISWSLFRLKSTESVMPSNHLHPLSSTSPTIFPSIRGFSNESVLHIRWPKCWRFSFSISPSNEYSELISFKIDLISLLSKEHSRVFSSTTV